MNEIFAVETGEHGGKYVDFKSFGIVGYAIIEKDAIFVPAIFIEKDQNVRMKDVIGALVKQTGIHKIIFTACCSELLKSKLKNIKREWDEWFEETEDYSHCIEVEWS